MWVFYVLALLPVVVGGILWLRNPEITWGEWLAGSAIGFALAGIFQCLSVFGMTTDEETWSGQITKVSDCPAWTEEWEEPHTMRVGNTTITYYTTEYDNHPEHWTCARDFGAYKDNEEISLGFFRQLVRAFGGKLGTDGTQPYYHGGSFDGGDNNRYSAFDLTGYISPVTVLRDFDNRVKAAPSLFSFSPVPANIGVFDWPENADWSHSERLLGTAPRDVDLLEFDRMNSHLGPTKLVNVILIGFGNNKASYAEWQRAKWIGGKKNDLVLCYGGKNGNRPAWARVFGWSDSEICKRNLETILIDNPVNNKILPLLEAEIRTNYTIKNWHAFDYITLDPPTWSYWVFVGVLVVTQGVFYCWASFNEFTRRRRSFRSGSRSRRIGISKGYYRSASLPRDTRPKDDDFDEWSL
jgi:hypothetical protein